MPTLVSITGTGGAATFDMGQGRPGRPSHLVSVDDFDLAEHLTTRKLYRDTRTAAQALGYVLPLGIGVGAQHPVRDVSPHAAMAWCNALTEVDPDGLGLTPVYRLASNNNVYRGQAQGLEPRKVARDRSIPLSQAGYHLPTERQWEYAARNRGARPGDEYSGAYGANTPDDVAYFRGAPIEIRGSGPDPAHEHAALITAAGYDVSVGWPHLQLYAANQPETRPVGFKLPNDLGIYNMSGQVMEITEGSLPKGLDYDDTGDYSDRLYRVVRGGKMLSNGRELLRVDMGARGVGFRVARG